MPDITIGKTAIRLARFGLLAACVVAAGLLGTAIWLLRARPRHGPGSIPAAKLPAPEMATVPNTSAAESAAVSEAPAAESIVLAPVVFLPMNLDDDMMDATAMETLAVIAPAMMHPESAVMTIPEP